MPLSVPSQGGLSPQGPQKGIHPFSTIHPQLEALQICPKRLLTLFLRKQGVRKSLIYLLRNTSLYWCVSEKL